MIVRVPHIFKILFPKYVWQLPASKPTVYLTFDDGPDPVITNAVLDILTDKKVKATFFCVGDNIYKFPQIAERVLQLNHKIGNHTFHHLKGWNTSTDKYLENIALCDKQLQTDLFRPPYGRIKNKQAKRILPNKKIIMWSLLSLDYEKNIDRAHILNKLLKHTKNGSIVVFHDSKKAANNMLFLLPKYIDAVQKMGYTFSTL